MSKYNIPKPLPESDRFYTLPIPKDGYKILGLGDGHIPHHCDETLELAFEQGLKEKIDCILLGGDMLDWFNLSTFEKLNSDLQYEIDTLHAFLRSLRKVFPKQKVIWMDGNHDFRLERFKMRNQGISQLDALKVPNLLHLKDFGIEYLDNYMTLKVGKLNVMHGHRLAGSGKMVARNKLMNAMNNIMFFHHHTVQDYFVKDLMGSVIGSYAVGCCCQLKPDYCVHNNWLNGFVIVKVNKDGSFYVDNKKIINGELR